MSGDALGKVNSASTSTERSAYSPNVLARDDGSQSSSTTEPVPPNDLDAIGPALDAVLNPNSSSDVLRAHVTILSTHLLHAVEQGSQGSQSQQVAHYKSRTDALSHFLDLDAASQRPDERDSLIREIHTLREHQSQPQQQQRSTYDYPQPPSTSYVPQSSMSSLMGPPTAFPLRLSQTMPSPESTPAPLVHHKREAGPTDEEQPSKRARTSAPRAAKAQADEKLDTIDEQASGVTEHSSYNPDAGDSQLERAMNSHSRRSLAANASTGRPAAAYDALALLAEQAVSAQDSQASMAETEPAVSQHLHLHHQVQPTAIPQGWSVPLPVYNQSAVFTLPADQGSFITDVHDPTRFNTAYYNRAAANEFGPITSQDSQLPRMPAPPAHLRDHLALNRGPHHFLPAIPLPPPPQHTPIAGPSGLPAISAHVSEPSTSSSPGPSEPRYSEPPHYMRRDSYEDEEEEEDEEDEEEEEEAPRTTRRGTSRADTSGGTKKRSPYIKWSMVEDEHLIRGICIHGQKWEAVSKLVPNRTYHQRFLRGLKSGNNLPAELRHYGAVMQDGIKRYSSQRQRSGKPKAPGLAATLEAPRIPLPDPVFI